MHGSQQAMAGYIMGDPGTHTLLYLPPGVLCVVHTTRDLQTLSITIVYYMLESADQRL